MQSALYHVDSKNNVYSGSEVLYNDHVTALTLGLNYQGTFLQMYHNVTFSVTNGLPMLGTPGTLTSSSVANANTSFIRYNLLTSDIRYFTQRISAALGSQFQYTSDTLVSSEQIGFGGQQFSPAFTPYIISGNSGAMGSLALRYDLLPLFSGNLNSCNHKYFMMLELFVTLKFLAPIMTMPQRSQLA